MKLVDIIILVFILLVLLLNLFPLVNEESEKDVYFIAYAIVLLPLYESIIHKKYEFLSLVASTVTVHLITDSCHIHDMCIASFDKAQFPDLDRFFTLYGLIHLMMFVVLADKTVRIFVPIIVFASFLSIHLEISAIVLVVVGLVHLIVLLQNYKQYYLEDLIVFVLTFVVASLLYFMKEETRLGEGNAVKRWFLFFYFIAFTISTGIKKEGVIHSMRIFSRLFGSAKEEKDMEPMEIVNRLDLIKTQ